MKFPQNAWKGERREGRNERRAGEDEFTDIAGPQ